ncbi:MmgE/PrpD family protein [Roseateles sp. DC23W]|uniref:MmgE/PrpD family protein n=1 Tax=Pelomonas dachongensis TaxID=3299029 RepID=A0ABW7EQX6_9BURK
MPEATVGRLAEVVAAWREATPGELLLHEAKRLLLNQLKAAAEASQQPTGQRLLAQATSAAPEGARARLWWSGAATTPQHAIAVHEHLLGLLDFGDTHLPTQGHFTARLLPGLLARAEAGHHDGGRLLTALLVGLEVAIAVASEEQAGAPRFEALALELGAVAARCTLEGLDRGAAMQALGEASGGWRAMPGSATLAALGNFDSLKGIALHCRPLPVAALAPVEAVLALRAQAGRRTLQTLQLALSPQAASRADDGLADSVAAAWLMGQFTVAETSPACRQHPATVDLRERIRWVVDERLDGVQACVLRAAYVDGGQEECRVEAFLGSPRGPLSDSQLSELFRGAASDVVRPRRAGEILQAVWGLERAADVGSLISLLRPAA